MHRASRAHLDLAPKGGVGQAVHLASCILHVCFVSGQQPNLQVKVDAAYALCVREELKRDTGPIYAWADSSPQAGSDYLLSCFVHIQEDAVVQCWEHFETLCASVKDFQDAVNAEDVPWLLR